jgi:hypothetical protein
MRWLPPHADRNPSHQSHLGGILGEINVETKLMNGALVGVACKSDSIREQVVMATSPHEPLNNMRSPDSAASSPEPEPRPTDIIVSVKERDAVLKVLEETAKPLVLWMISKSSEISQQRMEEILPILVRNGFVKRVDATDAVRYSRMCEPVPLREKVSEAPSSDGSLDSPHPPGSSFHPTVPMSKLTGIVVSAQERKAILEAITEAGKPLVMWKLAECSKIVQRRLEKILPVLVFEGFVNRLEAADAVRYSRAEIGVSLSKSQNGDHLKPLDPATHTKTNLDEASLDTHADDRTKSFPVLQLCCYGCGRDIKVHDKHYYPGKYYYCWRCLRRGITYINDQRDRPVLPTGCDPHEDDYSEESFPCEDDE